MRLPRLCWRACLMLLFAQGAFAQALVDTTWLREKLTRPDLVVLDLRPQGAYEQAHVPGAVHTSYAAWRRSSPTSEGDRLPPVSDMERYIGSLGIKSQSHVVLVSSGHGPSDLAAAARIYWSLKALGHSKVSILDGGLRGWQNTPGASVAAGWVAPVETRYQARPQAGYSASLENVRAARQRGTTLVDARSPEEYRGEVSGPPPERPGTIPGAVNLPFDIQVDGSGGAFLSLDLLRAIYRERGVALQGEQIVFCHTAHRAALSWFVAHELLGNDRVRLYDGSMAQWSATPGQPLQMSANRPSFLR